MGRMSDEAISGRLPWCCHLDVEGAPCPRDGEWLILDDSQARGMEDTVACTAHVGAMLGDGENRVYPIEGID